MSERSKSQQEALSFLEKLTEPEIESLGKEAIADRLANSVVDLEGFHKRLADRARELAIRERKSTGSAPPYLREAIEQLDPEGRLPQRARAAAEKAAAWIKGLGRNPSVPSLPRVLESYRKGDKQLSERDRELLDRERNELLRRLGDTDETR